MSVYDVRLAENIYVIPAYAEPHCVIVSGSEELQVTQWGLIPRTAKPGDTQRYDRENLFKNARARRFSRSGRGGCCGSITGASSP